MSKTSEFGEIQIRKLLLERFPEFTNKLPRQYVIFDRVGGGTRVYEWQGTYADVSFVFRAFLGPQMKIQSLRCVGLWQNWLAYENTLERDADIRSRISYEEELVGVLDNA